MKLIKKYNKKIKDYQINIKKKDINEYLKNKNLKKLFQRN